MAKFSARENGFVLVCCLTEAPCFPAAVKDPKSQTGPACALWRPKQEAALLGKLLKGQAHGSCAWEGPVRSFNLALPPACKQGLKRGLM